MSEYVAALIGGSLIGISASFLLLFHGRVVGSLGILGGLFDSSSKEKLWRVWFILGTIAGGVVASHAFPSNFPSSDKVDGIEYFALIAAGLLVGFGTQLGNGCTKWPWSLRYQSFILRSITATFIFILSGILALALSQRRVLLR